MLEMKYPAPECCETVQEFNGSVIPQDAGPRPVERHKYARRQYHRENDIYVRGWKILPHPRWIKGLGEGIPPITQLFTLTSELGSVLIRKDDLHFFGDGDELRKHGFVITGRAGYLKLHWNPRTALMRLHKDTTNRVKQFMVTELPDDVCQQLGEAVNPSNWGNRVPFADVVFGKSGQSRGGGWYGQYYDTPSYSQEEILKYILVAKKLCPKCRPWRDYVVGRAIHSFKPTLENCLQYIHGLRGAKEQPASRKLARFLTREARALKIKIPPKPRLPEPPKARGLKERTLKLISSAKPTLALAA
jgi:hypothetical protein